MRTHSFFAKTNKAPRERFFKPSDASSADDAAANSGRERAGSGTSTATVIDATSYVSTRHLRLMPPKKTPEDQLADLLYNAEHSDGMARTNYFEAMLKHLKRYPSLLNRAPNKYHSNPLELAIQIGSTYIIQKLLEMRATVRSEKQHLLESIMHLIKPQQLREQGPRFGRR